MPCVGGFVGRESVGSAVFDTRTVKGLKSVVRLSVTSLFIDIKSKMYSNRDNDTVETMFMVLTLINEFTVSVRTPWFY